MRQRRLCGQRFLKVTEIRDSKRVKSYSQRPAAGEVTARVGDVNLTFVTEVIKIPENE
jgi:hypothetical protein